MRKFYACFLTITMNSPAVSKVSQTLKLFTEVGNSSAQRTIQIKSTTFFADSSVYKITIKTVMPGSLLVHFRQPGYSN